MALFIRFIAFVALFVRFIACAALFVRFIALAPSVNHYPLYMPRGHFSLLVCVVVGDKGAKSNCIITYGSLLTDGLLEVIRKFSILF